MSTEIYISKRCPYSMKLLIELKDRPDLKGSIKVVSIDDEPFPNIIKTVPTMVSEGKLFNVNQIFKMLEESKQQGQQEQQAQQQGQQQAQQPVDKKEDGELSGYCSNGMCLGFSSLNDEDMNDITNFSPLDDNSPNLDVKNDGYAGGQKKSDNFDSDYEKLLTERGSMMPGRPPVR